MSRVCTAALGFVLLTVCAAPGSAGSPLVPEAVGLLLRDHADSEQLPVVCQAVQGREDGEKLLRSIRAKATSKDTKLQAAFYIAEVLREKESPTAEQSR